MQDAQHALVEVLERAGVGVERAQRGRSQGHGDRVDGEVAARQIVLQAARPHLRQRARRRVGLGAGHDHVQAEVLGLDRGGAEALVLDLQRAVQPLGRRACGAGRVALHHHVQVDGLRAPQEQVAHRSAHQVRARDVGEGIGHAGGARLRAQAGG